MTFKHEKSVSEKYKVSTNTGEVTFTPMFRKDRYSFNIGFSKYAGIAVPLYVFTSFIEAHKEGLKSFPKHWCEDLEETMTFSKEGVRDGYVKLTYDWSGFREVVVVSIKDIVKVCNGCLLKRQIANTFKIKRGVVDKKKHFQTNKESVSIVSDFLKNV